jgi:hypothetical protein
MALHEVFYAQPLGIGGEELLRVRRGTAVLEPGKAGRPLFVASSGESVGDLVLG